MPWQFLLKGLVIGFSIAAPVGPIGVLCIRRSLTHGRAAGLATGFGAASADAVFGFIAAFGLTSVASFLIEQQLWFGLGGGAFLCFLGIRTFWAPAADLRAPGRDLGAAHAFGSTLLLTLANPITILSFTAVFAGLGLASQAGYVAAAILVSGVFLGSALWWMALSSAADLLRSRFTPGWTRAVNRISGTIIFGFGITALLVPFKG